MSGLWVTIRHVVLFVRLMLSSRSMISIVFRVSRSPVGSSNSSTAGLFASARAMVTRCCSPPDNSDGKWAMRSCRPTSFSSCLVRSLRSRFVSCPAIVIGSSTFSKALMVASRLNVWNTNPILVKRSSDRKLSAESSSMTCPRISIEPVVALSSVPRMLSSEVFPPPEGPRSITNSPSRIGYTSDLGRRVMSFRATTPSSRPGRS
mmetsp:Transcript_49813/g.125234  ORF Transcript_49813/g.125234 Transcript_49813/m.125234 type:complete len:205 (+) Transcript_49813:104-718(+)